MSGNGKGRAVSIVGVGDTRFARHEDLGITDLASAAAREALSDSGLAASEIETLYVGNFCGERLTGDGFLGSLLANRLGIAGIPAVRLEGACASGGLAVQAAIQAVRHGLVEVAMAIGVEKMTAQPTSVVTEALAIAGDQAREMTAGATFPAMFGMIARAHMHKYGTTREQIAAVSVKNRRSGKFNPKAHFREEVGIEQVISSRSIADPLRLLDCPPISDGAAAVIVTTRDRAAEMVGSRATNVIGTGQASGPVALCDVANLAALEAPRLAAQRAYEDSGITPSQLDVVEVHDCFTISEILAVEALGLVGAGEGGPATESLFTSGQGGPMVNASGGLLSKGHPIGATGVSQVVEIVRQLHGEGSYERLGSPSLGMAYNMGGIGAVATATVLGKG